MSDFVEELVFDFYQERQLKETKNLILSKRIASLKSTDKFRFINENWEYLPYEGFAILSMVKNNPDNTGLLKQLSSIREKLSQALPIQKCFLLPEQSYHQTVANLLSAERFYKHLKEKNKIVEFPTLIKNIFEEAIQHKNKQVIKMRMIGLSVFSSAIGILGIFESKDDYNQIVSFRKSIYENTALNSLDIKRTRPFIGHITLAYLDGKISDIQQEKLLNTCNQINHQLKETPVYFNIKQTELRSYNHLAQFNFHKDFPTYQF